MTFASFCDYPYSYRGYSQGMTELEKFQLKYVCYDFTLKHNSFGAPLPTPPYCSTIFYTNASVHSSILLFSPQIARKPEKEHQNSGALFLSTGESERKDYNEVIKSTILR